VVPPADHEFRVGDRLTVHLDDRLSVARFDDRLPVHRTSYRGRIVSDADGVLGVEPLGYQVVYARQVVAEFQAPDGDPGPDPRPSRPLEPSPLDRVPDLARHEAGTHLGVLVTRGWTQPHTTVMAFLSSAAGDVFLVADPASTKVRHLVRDPRAVFVLDYRDTYDLVSPLDWAWKMVPARARLVGRSNPLFAEAQAAFLAKAPWEGAFFHHPTTILLHLEPERP